MSRVAVVERPLDLAALVAEVAHPAAGAIVTFIGVVRDSNAGKPVTGIDYSAYRPMAVGELSAIAATATGRFDGLQVAIEHRLGTLGIGDASIIVAASHAHRAAALDAVASIVDEVKRRVPIWKCEHYVDGTRDWVHASATAAATMGGGLA